jgi:DNA-directed RNA polymerase specialized sigma24 family protein
MSYEIASRMSWLVSWLGHADANGTERKRAQPRAWTHWFNNASHNVSSSAVPAQSVSSEWASSEAAGADDQLISQTLAASQLRKSVEQLPSHERQVLLLHVNNGLTYWEIAARLGKDEEVVLRDLAHAYSQLRLELSAESLHR